ncbi:chorismate mutase [Nocardia sp. JMUB6875]|uniref:chorismate mutase n=1 Tax=Nocardia sp. JMUB6875 TaxID=3158170 RepID=UPI0032E7A111
MKVLIAVAAASVALVAGQGVAHAQEAQSLDRLVGLVVDRLETADTVAAVKWAGAVRDGGEPVIDDPAREAAIYDAMGALGVERGLPAGWVRAVFEGQIEANKLVQRGLVAEWRSQLVSAPVPATDLAGIRPVIDRANTGIVDELSARRAELASGDCPARLTGTVLAVAGARHVDLLHQAALVRAALPLCEA